MLIGMFRVCFVEFAGGGSGGAVYLSLGSGSYGLTTAVALTNCTMTDNTAIGLCYVRSDCDCIVCVGLLCLVSGCFRQ